MTMAFKPASDRVTPDGQMDFSRGGPSKGVFADLNEWLNATIDGVVESPEKKGKPWPVLSPSMLNGECKRRTAYDYFDEIALDKRYRELRGQGRLAEWEKPLKFPGKMLRLFKLGERMEDDAAARLRAAGFELHTEDGDGKQYGFRSAEVGGWARLRGRIDGIITKSPAHKITVPCLWEHKSLNKSNFAGVKKHGLKKHKPNYYHQALTYMHFFSLTENPCFFTGECKDNSEWLCELIHYDEADAKIAIDTLAEVLEASRPEQLPRGASGSGEQMCAWCNHKDRCWTEAVPVGGAEPLPKPEWLK